MAKFNFHIFRTPICVYLHIIGRRLLHYTKNISMSQPDQGGQCQQCIIASITAFNQTPKHIPLCSRHPVLCLCSRRPVLLCYWLERAGCRPLEYRARLVLRREGWLSHSCRHHRMSEDCPKNVMGCNTFF